jgi:hypothetical protein
MGEGIIHKELKNVAMRWMKQRVVDIVCPEVKFNNIRCIADVVGINFKRKEVRVIEIKATRNDFFRDKKLFEEKTTYFYHSNYCYIMCPANTINIDEIPYGYGLLWVDENDNVVFLKKPIKNKNKLKTMFDTTLKNTTKKLTNLFLFSKENIENKDETNGFFDRRSKIKMVSFKCPSCKKQKKDLINIVKNKILHCSCGKDISIENIKYREITGFNKSFLKKISEIQ